MKKLFKIKYLISILACLTPLAALPANDTAEGGPPAPQQRDGQRQARVAACQADPQACRAERQARLEQRFKLADTDGNGMISRAEAEKAMPRLSRRFDRIDADHDGYITRDEIAAALKARFERHQRRMERPRSI